MAVAELLTQLVELTRREAGGCNNNVPFAKLRDGDAQEVLAGQLVAVSGASTAAGATG